MDDQWDEQRDNPRDDQRSRVTRDYPIGSGLDDFRNYFHRTCEAEGVVCAPNSSDVSALLQLDKCHLPHLAKRLLHALSILPAAERLSSASDRNGHLQDDLFRLLVATTTNDVDLAEIHPLLVAALDTGTNDSFLWAQVSRACIKPSLCCHINSGTDGTSNQEKPICKIQTLRGLLTGLVRYIRGYECFCKNGRRNPNYFGWGNDNPSSSFFEGALQRHRAFWSIGTLLKEKENRDVYPYGSVVSQPSFMEHLESAFWLLLWICIHHNGPYETCVSDFCLEWNSKDISKQLLGNMKKGLVSDERDFINFTEASFTPCSKPLMTWINELRKEVFPNDGRWEKEDPTLFARMVEVLEKAGEDPLVI